jgi:periplasmic protein TonB
MKKINNKMLPFMVGVFTIVFSLVSCTSGGDATEASVDSIQAKITADSLLLVQEVSAKKDMVAEGTAKPNPAKKKGKGSVIFQTTLDKEYEKQYMNMIIEMDKEGIYNRAEIRPSYPGGQKALAKFIQDNIVYPEIAIENGVEGSVDVMFAVDENGKVYTPQIKGDKAGYGLDQASLDVVSKMPRWNPGQIKGKNVKSYYTLPISYQINQ